MRLGAERRRGRRGCSAAVRHWAAAGVTVARTAVAAAAVAAAAAEAASSELFLTTVAWSRDRRLFRTAHL